MSGDAAGPAELIAVRHGQSVLNAAVGEDAVRELVEQGCGRDADVPLSALGEVQAARLGRWLAALPADRLPDAVLCSPYLRTRETARIVLTELDMADRSLPPLTVDERVRDREAGVLDAFHLITRRADDGDRNTELQRRLHIGELYYRPPAGESLADVALRVRSVLADLRRTHTDRRVLVVAHDAVVLMLHVALDGLSEDELRRTIETNPVSNASVSRWVRDDGRLRLVDYNRTDHLRASD